VTGAEVVGKVMKKRGATVEVEEPEEGEGWVEPIPPPAGPAPPTLSVIDGVGMGVGGKVASSGPRVMMNDGGITLCTGCT
jgi:hypothetical protein